MEKMTNLRRERKKAGLSILKLSELSGVSFEKVRQLDQGYRVENTSYEIKEKIANALNVNPFVVFPDELDRLEKRMQQLEGEAGKYMNPYELLRNFLPEMIIKESDESWIKLTLMLMERDELYEIFRSGMDPKTAMKILKKHARKHKTLK
ncbi:MAG: helix-turn-helix domain-containing protein [Candidatus Thorarchaeota archaeon]